MFSNSAVYFTKFTYKLQHVPALGHLEVRSI